MKLLSSSSAAAVLATIMMTATSFFSLPVVESKIISENTNDNNGKESSSTYEKLLRVAKQQQRDLSKTDESLFWVQETFDDYSIQSSDACQCQDGPWKNADEDEDPCDCDTGMWNGKDSNDRNKCPSSYESPRDIRLYVRTDEYSFDNDSFVFTSDTGTGVQELDGDGDHLARAIRGLDTKKYYVWEACIDAEADCYFFDFYTQKTSSRENFGFILLSNGVVQLHMSGDEYNSDAFQANDEMRYFKRVSLGRNCPSIEKVN